MDFSNTAKPTPIVAANVTPRSDIVSSQGSVSVDLPPEQTVQSAQAGEAVRLDIRARMQDSEANARRQQAANENAEQTAKQDLRETVERRLVIEPRSRAIVLEKKDPDTGETVSQLPDETLLKLRIYSRELTERALQVDDTERSTVERTA